MDDDDTVPLLVSVNEDRRVPLTILTGFLGAGKSTLLKRLLTEEHGYKIAVVMNEFGDTADIEAAAINKSSVVNPITSESTEFLELANGCLCCSIKDSGVAAIEALIAREREFDYVVLETTGMADPGPIASMFWQNEEYKSGIGRNISLDGVVCVVDAVFGEKQLLEDEKIDGKGESVRQVACADVILLNKIDCVSTESLLALETMIRQVNPSAPLHRTIRGQIAMDVVINIQAYNNTSAPRVLPEMPNTEHMHDNDCQRDLAHYQIRGVSSLMIDCPPLNSSIFDRLDAWVRTVLWEHHLPEAPQDRSIDILRCKGLFWHSDEQTQYVLQGVQTLYDFTRLEANGAGFPEKGKLVLIGKGLTPAVRSSLQNLF